MNPFIARLETLFGRAWQTALDRSGVISRRRAREFGAGEDSGEWLVSIVELLERLPPAEWPERWTGFGKASCRCPTLPLFADRLVQGRIRREDAVLVWDDLRDSEYPLPIANLAVGLLPARAFAGLPRDDRNRTEWSNWSRQWSHFHGGGTTMDWCTSDRYSPEYMVALWKIRGKLDGADLRNAIAQLRSEIHGFSERKVASLAERIRIAEEEGEPVT